MGIMIETDQGKIFGNFSIFKLQCIFRIVVDLLYFYRRYGIFFTLLITHIRRPIWITFFLVVLDHLCQYDDIPTVVLPDHIEKIIYRLGHGRLSGNEFSLSRKSINVISVNVRRVIGSGGINIRQINT
ncbi:GfV-C8-ORF2 [Ichnoviriform fumiferanae]|uniref:GfV-C8-ORF2 n=1 Tax=Ichnoviriform fumiferanae TaxID=419435 RepID=A2PZX4_9VIRU|nr:GfV-C8-ORF2 [Ichnoviriform fumiferanae]BAF45546.1 GfV-C8-ORF2 [Ichnoviriform fumiferanae]